MGREEVRSRVGMVDVVTFVVFVLMAMAVAMITAPRANAGTFGKGAEAVGPQRVFAAGACGIAKSCPK